MAAGEGGNDMIIDFSAHHIPEAIIARIKNFNLGEQALKEKIVQLLEENPQLLSYFNKYFS